VLGVVRTGSPNCPVAALQTWLTAATISKGRVFRSMSRYGTLGPALSDQAAALVVKHCVKLAGLDPAGFAGRSLCAGLATAAAASGVEERIKSPERSTSPVGPGTWHERGIRRPERPERPEPRAEHPAGPPWTRGNR
jgi:hypothetical protein